MYALYGQAKHKVHIVLIITETNVCTANVKKKKTFHPTQLLLNMTQLYSTAWGAGSAQLLLPHPIPSKHDPALQYCLGRRSAQLLLPHPIPSKHDPALQYCLGRRSAQLLLPHPIPSKHDPALQYCLGRSSAQLLLPHPF